MENGETNGGKEKMEINLVEATINKSQKFHLQEESC